MKTSNLINYQDSSVIHDFEDVYARDILYRDFDLRMITHPLTNDLMVLKDENAVKRSLINLVMTEPGDRPFQPNYGTPLRSMLFNIIELNPLDIEDQIERSIKTHEPRVNVKTVKIFDGRDSNSIGVQILYSIKNVSRDTDFTIRLKRLR